jgi:pimeloyl-ACP methyl ester carboxylesterase
VQKTVAAVAEPGGYSYQRHVDWMAEAIFDRLGLAGITLVGQDWGGLQLAAKPDRFARVVAANTALPTGNFPMGEAFLRWQRSARESPAFDIGRIIASGTVRKLPADVIAACDAPFPDDSYKAGARVFPSLVPTSPDDPAHEANTAWDVLLAYDRPFLCAYSDGDPDHPGRRGHVHRAGCPAPPGTRTPPSRAPGTSCRRTRANSRPRCRGLHRRHMRHRPAGQPGGPTYSVLPSRTRRLPSRPQGSGPSAACLCRAERANQGGYGS